MNILIFLVCVQVDCQRKKGSMKSSIKKVASLSLCLQKSELATHKFTVRSIRTLRM